MSDRKTRTHEAILASAAALLRERGIAASSVADVMKGAGLTVGGFYAHFASKEDLFRRTIEYASKWEILQSAVGANAKERAVDFVRRYLSREHRDVKGDGCLLPGTVPDVVKDDAYRGSLADSIADYGRAVGAVTGKELALGTIALLYGALSIARAVEGTPLSDDVLRSAKKLAQRALE